LLFFTNFILNTGAMRKLFLLVVTFTVFLNAQSALIHPYNFNNTNIESLKKDDQPTKNMEVLIKMRLKQIENYIGRKLTFKEKIAITLLKLKYKHGLENKGEPASKKGKTALTLGILALVTLFLFPLATIPLGILAIIYGNKAKKINPSDADAKTGVILGVISLSLIVLLVIAVIAVISSLTIR
jgi:hypothetical protein